MPRLLPFLMLALLTPMPAAADLVVTGPAETVYDWGTMRCATWDSPDAPARAWRTAAGTVRLIAGAEQTRAAEGATLDSVAHRCAVLHRGAHSDDPADRDDRTWIAGIYTEDGTHVTALGHMEYQGHRRPDRCPAGTYAQCWFNAVVALRSADGGRSFERDPTGPVAALPTRFSGAQAGRTGYFNPSNIIRRGAHLYVFVFAEAAGAQQRGVCLLRRPVAGDADDWRAWDGHGFSIRFADPYREAVDDPARHVCAPLAGLTSSLSGVVRLDPPGDPSGKPTGEPRGASAADRSGKPWSGYIAVTPATLRGTDGILRSGIWWTQSPDLIAWTPPRLLHEVALLWRRDCGADVTHAYPSLIDADSTSMSFESTDGTAWLYLVAFPLSDDCRTGPERDLLRLPVRWQPVPPLAAR